MSLARVPRYFALPSSLRTSLILSCGSLKFVMLLGRVSKRSASSSRYLALASSLGTSQEIFFSTYPEIKE